MSDAPSKSSTWKRAFEVLRSEVGAIHPRLHALNMGVKLLPRRSSGGVRARLMALAGFQMGQGTTVEGTPKISGGAGLFERLCVGANCSIDVDCVLDLDEKITIGDGVTVGPGVMILTSTHELASAQHRAGPVTRAPVNIGDGAWLRARSIILPGVTIGAGAIVEAGAVVNKDVAPHTRVGGIPAVQLEALGDT